ncbi:hypothetical protein M0812_16246 [Anaeramoeba flamelloides]|uniref:GyrI-like small molecule binding domain-containing protein n=1 Tax=Anaeramoeba flamelloides TaxID=1746091 RepID=A0AAV7ZIS7_9EUKA|nr:hypothetical protein M0812_16246 [Anaeramoeba flamelloides]
MLLQILLILFVLLLLILGCFWYLRIFETPAYSEQEFGPHYIIYEPHVGHYDKTNRLLSTLRKRLRQEAIPYTSSFAIFYDHPKEGTNYDQWTSVLGCVLDLQHPDGNQKKEIVGTDEKETNEKKESKDKSQDQENENNNENENENKIVNENEMQNTDSNQTKVDQIYLEKLKEKGLRSKKIEKMKIVKATWKSDRPFALSIGLSLKLSKFLKWARGKDYKIGHMMESYQGTIGRRGSTISYIFAQEDSDIFDRPELFVLSKKNN